MKHHTGKRKTVMTTRLPKTCQKQYEGGPAKSIILLIRSLVFNPINFRVQKCHGVRHGPGVQIFSKLKLGMNVVPSLHMCQHIAMKCVRANFLPALQATKLPKTAQPSPQHLLYTVPSSTSPRNPPQFCTSMSYFSRLQRVLSEKTSLNS